MMAKKLQKILAVVLVLSMCMSLLSVSAFAEETNVPDYVDPIESSDIVPDGKPNGTVTEGEPVSGTDENGNPTQTTTDTWTDTSTDGGTDAEANPSTTTTTNTNGSETTTVTQNPDGSTTTDVSGKETVTQSSTTTKTDVKEGQLVTDTTTVTNTVNGNTVSEVVDGTTTQAGAAGANTPVVVPEQEGSWVNDPNKPQTKNDWVDGTVSDDAWVQNGATQTPVTSNPDTNPIDVVGQQNPLNGNGSITINLTPSSTDRKTVQVSLADLVAQNVTIDNLYPATDADGDTEDIIENGVKVGTKTTIVTHVPQYVGEGADKQLVGYEVITTVTTIRETGNEKTTKDAVETPGTATDPVAADATNIVLPQEVIDAAKAPADVLDGNNNKIGTTTTTIEEVTDPVTGKIVYKVTKTTTTDVNDGGVSQTPTETYPDQNAPEVTETIPAARPADIEPYVNEKTGNTVTVTVNKVDGGYERVYVEKDSEGNEVATRTEKFFDTTVIINKKTETDATGKVVTTDTHKVVTEVMYYSATVENRDVTISSEKLTEMQKTVDTTTQSQVIQIGDQYFVYTGEMGAVDFSSTTVQNNDSGTALATISLDGSNWEQVRISKGDDKIADTDDDRYTLRPKGFVKQTSGNDLQNDGTINSSWYIPYTLNDLKTLQGKLSEGEFVLVGFGAYSEYNLFDDPGANKMGDEWYNNTFPDYNYPNANGAHSMKQFAILGKDGISYGYCVQLREPIRLSNGSYIENDNPNPSTNITNNDAYVYSQMGIEDMIGKTISIPLKGDQDALMPLNSIVSNGYMGTTSGVGSLQAVKDLLIRNGYATEAATLTDGQALAATQAAIWKYGNDSTVTFEGLKGYLVQYYPDAGVTPSKGNSQIAEHDQSKENMKHLAEDYANIEAVYNVLCKLATAAGGADVPDVVAKDDVKGATIVLKEEVALDAYNTSVSEAVKNAVKDTDNKVYNTDLSFTLAVSSSSYNGDLVVYVYANGDTEHPVATRRIAGSGSEALIDSAVRGADGNTTYTINDVKLAENVDVTIKLDGTQYLTGGVYVYSCDNSQNFIGGLNSLKQKFEMEVDLSFSVTDPAATTITTDTVQTIDTYKAYRTDTKTDTRGEVKYDRLGSGDLREEVTTTVNTKVYATVTVTETTEQNTSAEVEWWNTNTVYPSGGGGGGGGGTTGGGGGGGTTGGGEFFIGDEDVPLVDMIDEEVPLAEVPATGDNFAMWAMVSLMSGVGLIGLSLFGKKREEEMSA